MQFSAKLTLIMSCVFGVICLGFAISGFWSLSEITDPVNAADAKGFAWFWMFLAAIAAVFGGLSWWISRNEANDDKH
jgi:hypothetical protein